MFINACSYQPRGDLWGYWRSIPAFRFLGELYFRAPITFFVGENGSGKSTLLEAIAVNYGFNPEGGSINFRFSTGKKKNSGDKQTAKLALITATVALITQLIVLLEKIIEWLAKP